MLGGVRIIRYTRHVGGCPICGQSLDGSIVVYAPPSTDAYDTIDCARQAAKGAPHAPTALVLPTIDVVTSLGPSAAIGAARRLAPLPLGVAAGLMLVATGTASSLALWSSLPVSATRTSLTAAPAVASSAPSTTATPNLAPVNPPRPVATIADPGRSVRPKTPRVKDAIRVSPRESVPAPTSSPVAWQPEASPPPPPAPSSAVPHVEPAPPAAHSPRPTGKPKPKPQHPPAPPPQPAPPTSQPPEGGQSPADNGDSLPPALSPPAHSAGLPGHQGAESEEDGKAKKEKKPKKHSEGEGASAGAGEGDD